MSFEEPEKPNMPENPRGYDRQQDTGELSLDRTHFPQEQLIKKMDQRYEEQRALIETPDEELYGPAIRAIVRSGENITEDYIHESMAHVSGKELWFILIIDSESAQDNLAVLRLAEGKPLINTGSGGDRESLHFASIIHDYLSPSRQELVDPYKYYTEVGDLIREESFPNTPKGEVTFKQDDGLHDLLSRDDESGNVFISTMNEGNMNETVGRDKSNIWLRRVAQEVYRVTPSNGIFICIDSDTVTEEAEKIFGKEHRVNIGLTFDIFVKGEYKEFVRDYVERIKNTYLDLMVIYEEMSQELTTKEFSEFQDIYERAKYHAEFIREHDRLRQNPIKLIQVSKRFDINKLRWIEERYGDSDKRGLYARKLLDVYKKIQGSKKEDSSAEEESQESEE